ncbi:MAG TPA: cytochrome P450 [Acidimicrobiia bacterium]|nr:cytochrome P450 [Acidimicrobiia bacterium]
MTLDFETVNYFRPDSEIHQNPYPYYEWLRAHGPVWKHPRGVVFVTGYEEAIAIYHDPQTWSNCNTTAGPFVKMSVPLVGDDISPIIEAHRDELPFSDQLPSFDPPKHTAHRGLLMRLITPKRLKENEAFLWSFADQTMDEFLDRGECELIHDYAIPYTVMVVADLLGVPDEDRDKFRDHLVNETRSDHLEHKPLEFLYEQFTRYIEDRRAHPQNDVMTEMAQATFPDGTLPPVDDVMKIAANLFAAGGETTARLITGSLKIIGDRPDLQGQLCADPNLIAPFIEEVLRLETPLKGSFKLARVRTNVGGVDLPPGTTVYVMNDAANRDPRQYEDPPEFRLDRPNARQHLGFGHGIHTCAGSPLARAEAHASITRFLARTTDIRVSDAHHGPIDARRYTYDPTHMMRGVTELHLEFERNDKV